MNNELPKKITQEQKILDVLEAGDGNWINGRYFIQTMMISQAHARIFSLQRKGYNILASDFTDKYGFKSYRMVPLEPGQSKLFTPYHNCKDCIDGGLLQQTGVSCGHVRSI